MADLTIRRPSTERASQIVRDWDPLRAFREILSWDPFREMAPLGRTEPAGVFVPDFEVKETKDGYLFSADVPGVKEQDLDISLNGSRMTISGKREQESEEKSDAYYACERSYGSFTRSFTLPEGVDPEHVQAELKSGVLTLMVPKRPEVQTKKVTIKPSAKSIKA